MHDYRGDLRLLRDRRFGLLFAARTASVLGSAFAPVALAFGVLALPGATATSLSIVLAAESIPTIVFMLAGGVLADRFPRYRMMMAGESLSMLANLALGVMLFTGWAPIPALAAAAVLAGTSVALLWPALTGIIPEVVPPEHLQAANGVLQLGTNGARIAGYALGGATVVLVGGGVALMIAACLFAVAALLVAALKLPRAGRRDPARTSALTDLRDGWREFRSRQWLWVIVLQFSFTVAALQAAHGVLGPVVAKQELGGAGAWSAVLVGQAVGTIAGVVVAIRVRPRRPMLLATVLTFPLVVPYVLLGLAAPLWTVVLGAAMMGVCLDIFLVLWQTTLQREIPPESLSRVSAYDALGSFMFGPIGLLLAGPAAATLGPRPSLLVCAAVMALATLAALLAPDVRRMRAPSATASTGAEPAGAPASAGPAGAAGAGAAGPGPGGRGPAGAGAASSASGLTVPEGLAPVASPDHP